MSVFRSRKLFVAINFFCRFLFIFLLASLFRRLDGEEEEVFAIWLSLPASRMLRKQRRQLSGNPSLTPTPFVLPSLFVCSLLSAPSLETCGKTMEAASDATRKPELAPCSVEAFLLCTKTTKSQTSDGNSARNKKNVIKSLQKKLRRSHDAVCECVQLSLIRKVEWTSK